MYSLVLFLYFFGIVAMIPTSKDFNLKNIFVKRRRRYNSPYLKAIELADSIMNKNVKSYFRFVDDRYNEKWRKREEKSCYEFCAITCKVLCRNKWTYLTQYFCLLLYLLWSLKLISLMISALLFKCNTWITAMVKKMGRKIPSYCPC